MITEEDAEEYTQALGQVMAGGWRQRLLAWRLGVPQALGMTLGEWTENRLGGYVRQSIPERREAVAELTEEGLSNRQTAAILGIDETTVRRDLGGAANAAPEPTPEPAAAAFAAPDPDDGPLSLDQVDELVDVVNTSLANIAGALPHVANNSGDNEWFTPRSYIEAARAVLGGIDLDPASSEAANRIVQAAEFYDQNIDGLSQPWAGRVWMNPPYAAGIVDKFCDRMATSFTTGRVAAACVLVNNATETNWFQTVAAVASAICFIRGRVKFWHPTKLSAPLQGQAVLYLGDDPERFAAEFKAFGLVVSCG